MNLWMMIGLQISKKVGRICVEEKLLPEPIELNLSILFYIKLAKITLYFALKSPLIQRIVHGWMCPLLPLLIWNLGFQIIIGLVAVIIHPYKVEIE